MRPACNIAPTGHRPRGYPVAPPHLRPVPRPVPAGSDRPANQLEGTAAASAVGPAACLIYVLSRVFLVQELWEVSCWRRRFLFIKV